MLEQRTSISRRSSERGRCGRPQRPWWHGELRAALRRSPPGARHHYVQLQGCSEAKALRCLLGWVLSPLFPMQSLSGCVGPQDRAPSTPKRLGTVAWPSLRAPEDSTGESGREYWAGSCTPTATALASPLPRQNRDHGRAESISVALMPAAEAVQVVLNPPHVVRLSAGARRCSEQENSSAPLRHDGGVRKDGADGLGVRAQL